MLLIAFAALGFVLGHRLGIGRRGFVALGAASIGASALQVLHLVVTVDPEQRTLAPLVAGAVVVAGMVAGALLRRAPGSSRPA